MTSTFGPFLLLLMLPQHNWDLMGKARQVSLSFFRSRFQFISVRAHWPFSIFHFQLNLWVRSQKKVQNSWNEMNLTSRIRLFCASARSVAPFVSPIKGWARSGPRKWRWQWRIAKSAGGKLKLHTKRETKGESLAANLGIICYPRDKSVQKTGNSSSDSSTTGNNNIDNKCDTKKHEQTCRPIVYSRHCSRFSIFVGSASDAI